MKVLDEEIDLIENLKSSFIKYQLLWLFLLITIVLDSLTTINFMQNQSINHEANLIIRWLATIFGIIPGVIFGKLLQLISALVFSALSLKYSRAILMLLLSLNLLAVYNNI